MRSSPIVFFVIISIIISLLDTYIYYGIKKLVRDLNPKIVIGVKIAFWFVTIIAVTGIGAVMMFRSFIPTDSATGWFHFISGFFMLFYVPKLIFFVFNLLDDIIFGIRYLWNKIKHRPQISSSAPTITRRKFLNTTGIIFAAIPFVSLFYGIVKGRFNFTVRNIKIGFDNLPTKFSGVKILQISDFHLGSFVNNREEVEEAVNLINEQNADYVLFTGDMVNNVSGEAEDFKDMLLKIKAKKGKYSILGNHDYGDYVRWNSPAEKTQNLDNLKHLQREAGFDLLLDESRVLEIENERIEIVGVENWGLRPFPQYGNLEKALNRTQSDTFKILLTHDPTHWDAQVTDTDIDLTLSGHTHGAQFGVEIPGWRWSPANLRYEQWGGLYDKTNNNGRKQYIYVNTGIGFIGFPGRIGMPPEITVFELYNNKDLV